MALNLPSQPLLWKPIRLRPKRLRQFVQGKIRNHRTMLMRNHVEAPPATLLKLKQYAEAAARAESIESLLGVEVLAPARPSRRPFRAQLSAARPIDRPS